MAHGVSACLFSEREPPLAESAETIIHYEVAARIRAGKFVAPPVSHPIAQPRPYPAGLNQEL
jgi:hypothetical protein